MNRRRRVRWGPPIFWLLVIAALAIWYFAPRYLPDSVRERLPTPEMSPGHNPVLYKWKDDQGRWNVTDDPPDDRPFEEVRIDPDTNVLPPGVPPAPDRD